jgi:formylglycine-generating enzyme required for sulfatase activity
VNAPDPTTVLAEKVFAGGSSKPFAELTVDDVRARAAELRSAAGWGPTARVLPVAMAWGELSRYMESAAAKCVGDLEPGAVAERAEALWVVPPGGSLLR